MSPLWRWVVQRRLIEERGRTLLTILGVALGVAVFVSIRLASHTAMASFSDTVDTVAGRANLQIVPVAGEFDERLFLAVRGAPGVVAAAPVIERHVRARTAPGAAGAAADTAPGRRWGETLLLLGVDPLLEAPFARWRAPAAAGRDAALALLADPRAVAIPRTLAARHGLQDRDTLWVLASGRPVALIVRQVIDSEELQHAMGGNVAIVDIATAQEVLGRYGSIDRIDLLVDPGRRDAVRAALARTLPPAVRAEPPGSRTRQVENMVRAFDLNLMALSFIALFVSTTLIFNAVAMSVLRWRREIGILRGLGVTRGGVALLFLGEGLFFGVAGGALGVGLGILLGRGTLAAVSRTLTDLYLVQQAGTLRIDPAVALLGLGIGVAIALVSALAPALEAAATPPGVTMRQGILLEAQRLPVAGLTAAGLALLAAAAWVAVATVAEHRSFGGFAAAFLAVAGFSLCAPLVTRAGGRFASPVMRRLAGVEGALGARYLREALARTSVVVAALTVSVGMMVALSIMVGSFRRTVDTWITQTIRGDLYVEPVGHRETGSATVLPDSLVAAAAGIPGVVAVDTYRGTRITHAGALAFAVGIDFDVHRRFGNLQFVRGDSRDVLSAALERGGVVISESFARPRRLAAGDTLVLDAPAGRARLPVAGVYYDYSTDAGVVMMDRGRFAELWRDPRTESMALYFAPSADAGEARRRLLEIAGPGLVLSATPSRALRARVLTVFDQTFQITYALQAIAILVAVLGVIGTLTALILQRGREIGVLRAVGALRSQVRTMVLVESALIGLIGSVLGCVCGFGLALILVHVINRQFFGWTIRMTVDPWIFAQAIALMVAAATIAGLAPARVAATRVAAEAMRVE